MSQKEKLFIAIATKIREAMKEAGLTQAELGHLLGITHATVNSFVSGRSNPTANTIKKIAKATNKPIEYFFSNTGTIGGSVQVGNNNKIEESNKDKELELLKKEVELYKREAELLKKELAYFKKGDGK